MMLYWNCIKDMIRHTSHRYVEMMQIDTLSGEDIYSACGEYYRTTNYYEINMDRMDR